MKLKKLFVALMAVAMLLMTAACQSGPAASDDGAGEDGATDLSSLTVGQTDVKFGNYTWQVLDVQDGKALLLTEHIIDFRPYNKSCTEVDWAASDIRAYLNGDFITNNFSQEEQQKIVETTVTTPVNPWFNISAGEDTQDKVFLLSIEEAVKYFGDRGQLANGHPDSECFIDDEFNEKRIATTEDGTVEWWFLRSAGGENGRAADMSDMGLLIVYGDCTNAGHGTRPAMWVSMD